MSLLQIDQALISDFIAASFGLPIAHENLDFTPTPQTAYAELRVLPNPVEMRDLDATDDTTGIFRVILRYPLNAGAIAAKTMAQTILSRYNNGTDVLYSGQKLTVISSQRQQGYPEDGWYKLVLSINYYAHIAR